MSLKAQITKGRVTYIRALGYDSQRAHLILLLVEAPEFNRIARTVIFRGVQRLTDTWQEEEPMEPFDLDSIIGLDEYALAAGTRYVLQTECREIIFETAIEPEVIEHI